MNRGILKFSGLLPFAILLWEGCMKFKPFIKNNGVAALLVSDAFLRKNNMKFKYKGSLVDFPDIYFWHMIDNDQGTKVNGKFLDTLFHMINKKKADEVWGLKDDFKVPLEVLYDNIEKGKYSYEKDID